MLHQLVIKGEIEMNQNPFRKKLEWLEQQVGCWRLNVESWRFRVSLYLAPSESQLIESLREHFCRICNGCSIEDLRGDWKVVCPIETEELWAILPSMKAEHAFKYASHLKEAVSSVSSWDEIMVTCDPVFMVIQPSNSHPFEETWTHMFEALDLALSEGNERLHSKPSRHYSSDANMEEDRISIVEKMVKESPGDPSKHIGESSLPQPPRESREEA
jgi:hypothetical protein